MSEPAAQTKTTVVQEILRAIESVRFGSVEITVHDGRVTQIEKRDKVRFTVLPADKTQ